MLFGLGGSVYDWNDPFGRLFLQTLAVVAEFEANLNQPKLPESAQRSICRRHGAGEASLADLAEEYSVGRSTIHHIIHRAPAGEMTS